MRERWLIAQETSGRTRDAIIARGHEAVSVDILPHQRGGPHVVSDIFAFLAKDDDFDGAIMHPTCTKLTVAAAWTLYHPDDKALPTTERRAHPDFPNRRQEQADAVQHVRDLWEATSRIRKRALENPVGALSTQWRKPTQTIQPYQFGDDASKRTCLWLDGLPKLVPTLRRPGRWVIDARTGKLVERWANQTDQGQNRLTPSDNRWQVRSDTYPGIAAAFADQWAGAPVASAQPLLPGFAA